MKKNIIYIICIVLLMALCAAFMIGTMTTLYDRVLHFDKKWQLGFFLGFILLCACAICGYNKYFPGHKEGILQRQGVRRNEVLRNRVFWIVLLGAALGIRIVWVTTVAPPPVSDFGFYYALADDLANGEVFELDKSYIARYPHVIGLPTVLMVLFKVFGTSLGLVTFFNVVLSILAIIVVYVIGKKLMGRRQGRIAAVMMAFYPPNILFCSLVDTEILHQLMFCCCILVLMYAVQMKDKSASQSIPALAQLRRPVSTVGDHKPRPMDRSSGKVFGMQCVLFAALGVLMELCNGVRPMSALLILAVLFCLIFFMRKSMKNLKIAFVMCSVMLVSYAVTGLMIKGGIEKVVGMPVAKGDMGYTLAVGLNIESLGAWNEDDTRLITQLHQVMTAPEAHKKMQELAWKRIKEDPAGIAGLMATKTQRMWSSDAAAIMFLQLSYEGSGLEVPEDLIGRTGWVTMITYFCYLLLLLLTIYGLGNLVREKGFNPSIFFVVVILGTLAAFCLLESQERYRFFVMPLMILLAAQAFRGTKAKRQV